jgi:hypothetical protein
MNPIKRKVIQLDDHRPVRGSIEDVVIQLEDIEARKDMITFEIDARAAYKRHARQLGKHPDLLTEKEKTDAVIFEGIRVAQKGNIRDWLWYIVAVSIIPLILLYALYLIK